MLGAFYSLDAEDKKNESVSVLKAYLTVETASTHCERAGQKAAGGWRRKSFT